MLVVTLDHLRQLCPKTPPQQLAPLVGPLNESFPHAGVDTGLRAAMYVGELLVETGYLRRFEEDLDYSIVRLMAVWKRRFPTEESAAPYAHNPEKLANHVYADRNGNGDEESGDGWKFHGRGACALTFFDNYRLCGRFYAMDLIQHPELLLLPENIFKPAAWFWHLHGLGPRSDAGQVAPVTQVLNGGQTDAEMRLNACKLCCAVFAIAPLPKQV